MTASSGKTVIPSPVDTICFNVSNELPSNMLPKRELYLRAISGQNDRTWSRKQCPSPSISKFSSANCSGSITRCLHHGWRSEEHTSELQSRPHLVCRLLL